MTMNKNECQNCGALLSDKDEFCKYCGSPNPNFENVKPSQQILSSFTKTVNNETKKFCGSWAIVILLVFVFWPAALIYYIANRK